MIKKWSQFNINEEAAPMSFGEFNKPKTYKETILYGRVNLRNKCLTTLIDAIDTAFVEVHEIYNTVSGDADFTSENLLNSDAVSTMERQVAMNMNLDSVFKTVKTDKVNMEVLKELEDERSSCVEGDYVICIINNPYLEIVLTKVKSEALSPYRHTTNEIPQTKKLYITSSASEHYLSNDRSDGVLLVVKKETYDDFAGSH